MSSPTAGSGPTPFTIGKSFVKQFYNVLTTNPDSIYRFYRPSSVLSHGEGNNPTETTAMEELGDSPAAQLKDRFFSWAASESDPVRFELEHGAIDAQGSVGGGVLLVVTGHLYVGDLRKAFCHTFFLNMIPDSKKRQYYVHNDVLRFLHESEPSLKEAALSAVQEADDENENENENEHENQNQNQNDHENLNQNQNQNHIEHQVKDLNKQAAEPSIQKETQYQSQEQLVDNAIDQSQSKMVQEEPQTNPIVVKVKHDSLTPEEQEEGVEESKEEPEDDDDEQDPNIAQLTHQTNPDNQEAETENQTQSVTSKDQRENINGTINPNELSALQTPRASPGSWASLVAGGGTSAPLPSPTPPTPPAPKPKASIPKPPKQPEQTTETKVETVAKPEPKSRHKRDPDCTIVIKKVPSDTKESDVRAMFEPFATQAKASIIGINVSAHKGLAFVDYDTVAPVLAIIEKDKEAPFTMGGRTLEVEQKTLDIRRREGRRNNFRSGSPGSGYRRNNNNNHQRHRGSGRGERGGGRNSGRGGGRG